MFVRPSVHRYYRYYFRMTNGAVFESNVLNKSLPFLFLSVDLCARACLWFFFRWADQLTNRRPGQPINLYNCENKICIDIVELIKKKMSNFFCKLSSGWNISFSGEKWVGQFATTLPGIIPLILTSILFAKGNQSFDYPSCIAFRVRRSFETRRLIWHIPVCFGPNSCNVRGMGHLWIKVRCILNFFHSFIYFDF